MRMKYGWMLNGGLLGEGASKPASKKGDFILNSFVFENRVVP
jgi:hypothetical protein